MKVLITGSEGFIGSHLLEKIVKKGFKVRAFMQYHFQNNRGCIEDIDKELLKSVEIVSGDIRDPFEMNLAIKNCDYVINLAALIGIPYSFKAPKNYFDTNVIGTMNVLEASKKNSVKKIILTSTSEVYGTAKTVPIKEDHPLNAQSPYAASKISSDFLGMSYFYTYNLPITILRPFNTFGPRQSARAVIPTIFSQCYENKSIKIGNINTTRDFTYVSDLCNAYEKLLTSNKKSAFGNVYNIGTNNEISIIELINLIQKICKSNKKIIQEKSRKRKKSSEVNRLMCDSSSFQKLTSWKPKVSLKEGLKKFNDWYVSNKNYYKPNQYNV